MKKSFLLMLFLIFSVLLTSFILVFGQEKYGPPISSCTANCQSCTSNSNCCSGYCNGITPTKICLPTTCNTLMDRIRSAFYTNCDSTNYDPVADLNKDGVVDSKDVALVGKNCDNDAACKWSLWNETSPCVTTITLSTTTTIETRHYFPVSHSDTCPSGYFKECFPPGPEGQSGCTCEINAISCPLPPEEIPAARGGAIVKYPEDTLTYRDCRWNKNAVPSGVVCRCIANPNELVPVSASTVRCEEWTNKVEIGYDPRSASCTAENAKKYCPDAVCSLRMVVLDSEGPICYSWAEQNYNTMISTQMISPHASYGAGIDHQFELVLDLSTTKYMYRAGTLENMIKEAISGFYRVHPLHKFISWLAGESACYNMEGVSLT